MKKSALLCIMVLFLFACNSTSKTENKDQKEKKEHRILSLNGTITEILFALDKQKEICGIDVTSTYPLETEKIENLGHISMISAEGILALNPSCVLGFKDEMKPVLVEQLEKANIEVILFEREFTVKGTEKVIRNIAKWANEIEKGETLVSNLRKELEKVKSLKIHPLVLFVYARGAGNMMVAGDETQMKAVIELAGGKNAVAGFPGFKPLTPEAVVNANPELILMFDSGIESLSGKNALLEIPGVQLTEAGKKNAFLGMDGLKLSGFGPRLGEAVFELNQVLSKLK